MGYVAEGAAYVSGIFLIGAGLYLIIRGRFPAWWERRLLWPLVQVTPRISHLQGLVALGLGASILAIAFSTVVPQDAGAILVLVAFAVYLAAVALFFFSTWLSRRPPPSSV